MSENPIFQRTQLLIEPTGLAKLNQANVLLIGLGGVGSYAAEFMVRAGIQKLTIVDGDSVDITNINRQLPALHSTIGKRKVEVMASRLLDINPNLELTQIDDFLTPDKMENIINTNYHYVLDCIDSVQPKQYVIVTCKNKGVNVISSMGAGGRVDPSKVKIADVSKTYNCPFAQQIRKGLRKKGIMNGVTAVFSDEVVDKKTMMLTEGTAFKKSFYGTISYLPAVFGLYMASHVVRSILNDEL